MPKTPFDIGIDHFNYVALVIFGLATLGYHIGYNVASRMSPLSTVKGKIHRYRKDWIEGILREGKVLIAVQSVRNQIMATTWLASSVLLVLAFLLTGALRGTDPLHDNALFEILGVQDFGWLRYKIHLLLVTYGFAFLMFLFSIRHIVLFNTLIGVSPDLIRQVEGLEPSEYLGQLMNRASSRFTYGLRGTYFSLPLIAWLFSTWAFVVCTLIIWAWLYFLLDTRHSPRASRPQVP